MIKIEPKYIKDARKRIKWALKDSGIKLIELDTETVCYMTCEDAGDCNNGILNGEKCHVYDAVSIILISEKENI